MTSIEALEKIRNHILNGDHSDGLIAPILNWCDEALETAYMKKWNARIPKDVEPPLEEDEVMAMAASTMDNLNATLGSGEEDESPKMKEAREIREMKLRTPMARLFAEAIAADLEAEDMAEKGRCAKYRAALKQIIQFDSDMNETINRSGYATGGEAGHYFYKAVKVAKEALRNG